MASAFFVTAFLAGSLPAGTGLLPDAAVFGAGMMSGIAVVALARALHRIRPPARPRQQVSGSVPAIAVSGRDYVHVDLGRRGVTVADGPTAVTDRLLTAAAADLAAGWHSRPGTLILVGCPGLPPAAGSVRSYDDLAAALDQVVADLVARRRISAGDDRALTVLVSRVAPTAAQLTLLADLAAEPGGAAALLPGPLPPAPLPSRTPPPATLPPQPIVVTEPVVPQVAASLRIGVLGPLTVNGQPGALLPAQSQLIVALGLHRGGLSNRQLCALLGADSAHPRPADSLRQLIVRTRRQLGPAADGREWIEHLGGGRYALHQDTRLDWAEFDALTAAGIAARDSERLTTALNMVRGQPFTECYYWWLDPALIASVTTRIVAAARELAEVSLERGDPASAARAARAGLVADSAAERLWQVLMRAEHAAGNLAGVREAWHRCQDAIAEISADGRPGVATTAVYTGLLAR